MTTKQDVLDQLQKQIDAFSAQSTQEHVGTVLSVKDGTVRIRGLKEAGASEMLDFGNTVFGVALNLEEECVGAVVLGNASHIKEGDTVKATGRVLSIPVSANMIGRVVNALGAPVDGKGDIHASTYAPIEKIAPGVMTRKSVSVPMQTGITAIDAMIPIGRGQRELIIGDRQTGKTAIAIDTIMNQRGQNMKCVYVAIGQKESKIAKIFAKLEEAGAMEYTTIVLAGASEPAALSYIAPYAGCAIAEFFMAKGEDVLIVYDDLSKHAWAYREIALLLRRPPGREAYPGDVFYLHSRLLERSARVNEKNGGGSITALPIIETQAGDVSAYIPTNVISITDGQIFLESDLFYRGIRPALNVGISVSRVGSSAQIKPMKKVAGKLKLAMAQFRELEAFAQFSSDLDPQTKKQIELGKRMTELLKQTQYAPIPVEQQVLAIYAVSNGFFDAVDIENIQPTRDRLMEHVQNSTPQLLEKIAQGDWSDELQEEVKAACERCMQTR